MATKKETEENDGTGRETVEKTQAVLDTLETAAEQGTKQQSVGTSVQDQYRAFVQQRAADARQAAETAVGNASVLGGGYGTSYAASAAAQAYQQQMQNNPLLRPSLRAEALREYETKQNGVQNLFSALLGQENQDLAQKAMEQADSSAWRDYQQSRIDEKDSDKKKWQDDIWSGIQWVLSTAMDTYDTYKGFKQQKWENEFAEKKYQDSMAAQAWQQEFSEQQLKAQTDAQSWQQSFQEQQYQDSRSDAQWEQQYKEQMYRDSRTDAQWEQQYKEQQLGATQAAAARAAAQQAWQQAFEEREYQDSRTDAAQKQNLQLLEAVGDMAQYGYTGEEYLEEARKLGYRTPEELEAYLAGRLAR